MTARLCWDVSVEWLGFDLRRADERCEVPLGARPNDCVLLIYDTNEIPSQRLSRVTTIAEAREILKHEGYDPGCTVDLSDLLEASEPSVNQDGSTNRGWWIPPTGGEWDDLLWDLRWSRKIIRDGQAFQVCEDWGVVPEIEGYEP